HRRRTRPRRPRRRQQDRLPGAGAVERGRSARELVSGRAARLVAPVGRPCQRACRRRRAFLSRSRAAAHGGAAARFLEWIGLELLPGNVLFLFRGGADARPAAGLRESAMVSTVLIVILIIALMVGLSGRFGGYGFGHGHSGMGLIGVILVVILVLKLLHKI